MDTTGKLAPGIVGITVCLILVLAVALPVIGAMISTIDVDEASGSNDIQETPGLTKHTRAASWHYSNGLVSMDGGQAHLTDDWMMVTDSMVVQDHIVDVHEITHLTVIKEPSDYVVLSEADIRFDGQRLTVTGPLADGTGTATISDSCAYVLATYVADFGRIDYGYTGLDSAAVVLGEGGMMIKSLIDHDIRNMEVTGAVIFDGSTFRAIDTGSIDVSGMAADMGTVSVGGLDVPEVGGITNDGAPVTGWYAPLHWEYTDDSAAAMAKTVLSILPLILVVALFVLVVRWMQAGVGGSETSAFLGGSRAPRRPNDGWRDKR